MSTKKENRSKNSTLSLRLFPEQARFIEEMATKFGVKKVDLIEALIHLFQSSNEDTQKKIIKTYLTKNL